MDKNAKQTRAAKEREEKEALDHILRWVVGGGVMEFLLLLLNRYWCNYTISQINLRLGLGTAVKILAVAALVCAVGAFFWWSGARKSEKSAGLPAMLCLFMAGVSVSCFAAWFLSDVGVQFMYVLVPAVVVLALIYYLYQHEFFLVAAQSTLSLLGIWICSRGLGSAGAVLCYVFVVAAALLILLGAGVCRKVQGSQGVLERKGKQVRLFAKDANYGLLYAGAVIALVLLIVAAIGVSSMALYAVAVAWLLIMAVYYTVKLM